MLLRPAEEAHTKVLGQQLHLDNLSAMGYMLHGMWCQMMSTYNLVGAAVLLAWQPFDCSFIQGGICINNEIKNSPSHTYLSCGSISSKKRIALQGVLDTT